MDYNRKPKMILFDVGGTLFDDGPCKPIDGFSKLRLMAENPENTTDDFLAKCWDEYLEDMNEIKSKSGVKLDSPLSAVIKYATMHGGLRINIPLEEQEELFDRYNSSRSVIEGIPELLSTLKMLGIRSAIISNNMMSGESLSLAIKHWIPTSEFEFCLTSADLLYTKPCKFLFTAAAKYADLDPGDCWYCGDGRIPDVDGAKNGGMSPVLLKRSAELPFEICTDGNNGAYLTINHWDVLREYITKL